MKYHTIAADPPWHLEMGKMRTGNAWAKGKSFSSNVIKPLPYPTVSIADITALPIKDLAEKDAHLYLWTINKYVEQTYAIARAWGFTPVQLLTWCKRPMGLGLGGTYVNTSEFILFAKRGHLKAKQRIDSTWWLWKRGKHSQKPEAFQDMVETVSPGPYLELFARRTRPNWHVLGDAIDGSDIRDSLPTLAA